MISNFSHLQTQDVHKCIHITLKETVNIQQFDLYFINVLQREIQKNNKAVWVHLNKQNMHLVSTILKHNFKIHHGIDQILVLYRWLSPLSDLVPKYSLVIVACGAIVILNNKILLVEESNGRRKDTWGIPGGISDINQPISKATERQLKQQTNLTGTFKYIVYFRQLSDQLYGGSDIYFANYVEIKQGQQKNIKLCQRQLKGYKWVDLAEVQSFFSTHNINGTQKYLLTYLNELYSKKFDFSAMPNETKQFKYTIRGTQKSYREHKLIIL